MKKMLNLEFLNGRGDVGILLLRLMVGFVFAFHGYDKLANMGVDNFAGWLGSMNIPMPTLNAYLATFTELLGGLALMAGAMTRLVSLPLAFTMVVAIVSVHLENGFKASEGGYEFALLMLVASLALTFMGAGKYSVDDKLLFNRRA